MYEIESLVCEYKTRSHPPLIVHEVGKYNLYLSLQSLGLDWEGDIYSQLKYNMYDIAHILWAVAYPIYNLYHSTWERSWYLVHILNTIRVLQGRPRAYPICDNQFKIKDFEQVLPETQRVIFENSHFDLDIPHSKLLEVSVANYFLRQIDYPCIAGRNIMEIGLDEKNLERDLIESLEIWLK